MIYLAMCPAIAFPFTVSNRFRDLDSWMIVAAMFVIPCCFTWVFSYFISACINTQIMVSRQFRAADLYPFSFGWNLFVRITVYLKGTFPKYFFCSAPVYMGLRRVARGCEWFGMLACHVAMTANRLPRSHYSGSEPERYIAMHVCGFAYRKVWLKTYLTCLAFGGARMGVRSTSALEGGR